MLGSNNARKKAIEDTVAVAGGGPKPALLLFAGSRDKPQWMPGMMVVPWNTKGNKQNVDKHQFLSWTAVRGRRCSPFDLVDQGKGEHNRLHWMGIECSLSCFVCAQCDAKMHAVVGRGFGGHAIGVPVAVLKLGVGVRIGLTGEPAICTEVIKDKIAEVTEHGGVGEKILQLIQKGAHGEGRGPGMNVDAPV